ncbi:MarR family transcriptional regulator [Cohnella boryungensis]|uniref:MarR family transcriptional regulator n=1 Tax=Cohnella boryungensis TaxID=768479 RepID=A0ABV8SEX1_9BACL
MNKNSRIQNPLTVIAIFAGLAETAGTIVLLGLPLEIQQVFVWFVMLLPVLLIVSFFLVLIFKHKVLYAPSDFSNDQYFMDLLESKDKKLQEVALAVEETKSLAESMSPTDADNINELKKKLEEIEDTVHSAKEGNTSEFEFSYKLYKKNTEETENTLIQILKSKAPAGLTLDDICMNIDKSRRFVSIIIKRLITKGLVVRRDEKYFITKHHASAFDEELV